MIKKDALPIDVLNSHDIGFLLNALLSVVNTNGDCTPSFNSNGYDVSDELDYVLKRTPKEINDEVNDKMTVDYEGFGQSAEHVRHAILFWIETGYGLAIGRYADMESVNTRSAIRLFMSSEDRQLVELFEGISLGMRGHTVDTVRALSKLLDVPSYSHASDPNT